MEWRQRTSKLTRCVLWMLTFVLCVYIGLFVFATAWYPQPSGVRLYTRFALNQQKSTRDLSASQVVAEFAHAVIQNAGRVAIPEASLPYPREAIQSALQGLAKNSPTWDSEFPPKKLLFDALTVELANFVSDPALYSPDAIWSRQRAAITNLGGFHDLETYTGEKPLRAANAYHGVREMTYPKHSRERDAGVGYGTVGFLLFVAIKFISRLFPSFRSLGESWTAWRFAVFFLTGMFAVGIIQYPIAAFGASLEHAVVGTFWDPVADWIVAALGLLFSQLFLSALFDIVVWPGAGPLAVKTGQPVPVPKLDENVARPNFRFLAGIAALAVWLGVIGVCAAFWSRPQETVSATLWILVIGLPLAIALTVICVTGKAPAWFLRK